MMNATVSTLSIKVAVTVAVLAGTLGTVACSGGKEPGSETSTALSAPRSVLETEQGSESPHEAPLSVSPAALDLGRIPIEGGKVDAPFRVRNESAEPVNLRGVYSSCGCTTAVLQFTDGSKAGPFGMPGHDLPTGLRRSLQPQEDLEVRVIFDPAAHGLAGVGAVERMVYLELDDGSIATLVVTGQVVIE